jgi:hypothetical protein
MATQLHNYPNPYDLDDLDERVLTAAAAAAVAKCIVTSCGAESDLVGYEALTPAPAAAAAAAAAAALLCDVMQGGDDSDDDEDDDASDEDEDDDSELDESDEEGVLYDAVTLAC